MDNRSKLLADWKRLRASYFLKYEEDKTKFEKYHAHDPLYPSVIKHLDKSFKEINQIAEDEINNLMKKEEIPPNV